MDSALTVYSLDPLQDDRWADFVASHPDASVFHSPGWLEALQKTYGYSLVVYTTTPPKCRLANGIVFARIRSWLTGSRLVSLPFADHCEPLAQDPAERALILASIKSALASEGLKYIEIRPRFSDFSDQPGMEKSGSFCFHALDTRPGLLDLFRALQKDSIQRKIRRAEREGLCYQEGTSEELLKAFYHVILLTRRRHTLPPQPLAWFRNLVTCFGERAKIRVASKGGRPIASTLTLVHRDTMVYKYGGSDAADHNLGGVPFLFWKAIEHAKANEVREFDFGRSEYDNPGLITFKDRWGSQRGELTYWRLRSRPAHGNGLWKLKIAGPIFARMPDRLLAASGRMLYRHFG